MNLAAVRKVAVAVFRESVRDRVPYSLVIFAVVLMAASFLMSRLTAGQDLKVIKDLARHGFRLRKIRRCLGPLREHPAKTSRLAQSLKYLTDGESLFVITDDRQKILDAMERQFVLSLGIGNLVRELNGEVERVARGPERKGSRGLGRLREKGSGAA